MYVYMYVYIHINVHIYKVPFSLLSTKSRFNCKCFFFSLTFLDQHFQKRGHAPAMNMPLPISQTFVLCEDGLTLNIQDDGGSVDTLIVCALNSVNAGIFSGHILDLQ